MWNKIEQFMNEGSGPAKIAAGGICLALGIYLCIEGCTPRLRGGDAVDVNILLVPGLFLIICGGVVFRKGLKTMDDDRPQQP